MCLTQTLLNPLPLLLKTEFSPHPLISHHLLLSSSQSNQFPPSTSYMLPPPLCLSTATHGARMGEDGHTNSLKWRSPEMWNGKTRPFFPIQTPASSWSAFFWKIASSWLLMNIVVKNLNNISNKPRIYLPSGFFTSEVPPSPKHCQGMTFHQHVYGTAIKQQHTQELFSNLHQGENNKIKVLKTMTKVWLGRQSAFSFAICFADSQRAQCGFKNLVQPAGAIPAASSQGNVLGQRKFTVSSWLLLP